MAVVKKGMSTGSKVAIGIGVALLLGGIAYFILSSSKKKKNKKTCEDAGGTYDEKTKTCVMPVVEVVKDPPKPFKDAYDNLNFDTGKATIKAESFPSLDEVVNVLSSNPNLSLKLVGYTDNKGPLQYNIDLSTARANAVKNYLVSKGIADARITTEGKGPANPIASNDTPTGRLANRRVEFIVGKTSTAPVMEPETPVVPGLTPSVSAGTVTTEVITNDVPGARPTNIQAFQDWMDITDPTWVNGKPLKRGPGYGNFGPSTKKAWAIHGTAFVNK